MSSTMSARYEARQGNCSWWSPIRFSLAIHHASKRLFLLTATLYDYRSFRSPHVHFVVWKVKSPPPHESPRSSSTPPAVLSFYTEQYDVLTLAWHEGVSLLPGFHSSITAAACRTGFEQYGLSSSRSSCSLQALNVFRGLGMFLCTHIVCFVFIQHSF